VARSNSEQRRHLRYHFPCTIEYEIRSGSGTRIHRGVTINISNAGLCLCVFETFSEEAEITVKSFLPVDHRKAVVRWIKAVDHNYYKVGLMFTD